VRLRPRASNRPITYCASDPSGRRRSSARARSAKVQSEARPGGSVRARAGMPAGENSAAPRFGRSAQAPGRMVGSLMPARSGGRVWRRRARECCAAPGFEPSVLAPGRSILPAGRPAAESWTAGLWGQTETATPQGLGPSAGKIPCEGFPIWCRRRLRRAERSPVRSSRGFRHCRGGVASARRKRCARKRTARGGRPA